MTKVSTRIIFFSVIFISTVILGYLFFLSRQTLQPTTNCVTERREFTVQGNSLKGLLEPNAKVTGEMGYYACHDAARGDVVLYKYAGDPNPIIKIIRGIPGDAFALSPTPPGFSPQGWFILINGAILTNANDKQYITDARGERMLSLYVRDYHSVIPPDAYLILGNLPEGSIDSTRFGLVGKSDLMGKVLR